jgi:hypothetical protein
VAGHAPQEERPQQRPQRRGELRLCQDQLGQLAPSTGSSSAVFVAREWFNENGPASPSKK